MKASELVALRLRSLVWINELAGGFVYEMKFHPLRRWRFDFAIPKYKIAIEVEGAVWINGRHTRGSGFIKDIEKYNAATILGWRVLKYTKENMANLEGDIKELICLLKNQ